MEYYRLETVRESLHLDFGAALGPSRAAGRSRIELWQRTVAGHDYRTALQWEFNEELLGEEMVLAAAEALAIHPPAELVRKVKARGGLWLGPSPPAP